jgi:hypothetical protein
VARRPSIRKAFGARAGLGVTATIRAQRYGTVYTLTLGSSRSVGAIGYWSGGEVLEKGARVIVTRRPDARTWNIEGRALTDTSGTDVQGNTLAFEASDPSAFQSDRVVPTTMQAAIQNVASRVKSLEAGTGQQEIVARYPGF